MQEEARQEETDEVLFLVLFSLFAPSSSFFSGGLASFFSLDQNPNNQKERAERKKEIIERDQKKGIEEFGRLNKIYPIKRGPLIVVALYYITSASSWSKVLARTVLSSVLVEILSRILSYSIGVAPTRKLKNGFFFI